MLLLLNVGVLLFEWRHIKTILLTILQREYIYHFNGWETGINLLLVAAVGVLIGSELLGYARESDERLAPPPPQQVGVAARAGRPR